MKNLTTTLILLFLAQTSWAIDIWVWSNEEVSLHYKIIGVNEDHPCGATSNIEIQRFPDPDAASEIGMEKVVEYSDDKILNRWSVPIDKYVLALEGPSVYVPYKKQSLRLFTGGKYELASTPHYESKWIRQCPKVILSEFPGSSYIVCHEYRDLQTKKIRRIAYEGPCT